MIRFDAVSKAFGTNVVLDSLDFSVDHGEKVTIIGPSGSGKTTILRILMTLETPDSGVVVVEGEPLWDASAGKPKATRDTRRIQRKLGMVFQHFNLFPHMTLLQNVMEAPVHTLGRDAQEFEEEARSLLAQVGLSQHLSHKPAQLSGGQQQRAAIARALALHPQILLFDEPTSALDPEMVGDVLKVIKEVADSHYITMLLVTHEMRFAAEISDRVVMFDSGSVVEQGTPLQIFGDPSQERTKRFLQAVSQK